MGYGAKSRHGTGLTLEERRTVSSTTHWSVFSGRAAHGGAGNGSTDGGRRAGKNGGRRTGARWAWVRTGGAGKEMREEQGGRVGVDEGGRRRRRPRAPNLRRRAAPSILPFGRHGNTGWLSADMPAGEARTRKITYASREFRHGTFFFCSWHSWGWLYSCFQATYLYYTPKTRSMLLHVLY